jgi:2Fe-2S ferredoxin
MPKITFKNTGETFEVPAGSSVLECAINHNIPLNHDCGGNCACTTCHIYVESGIENLEPMAEDERGLLESNDKLDEVSRLGCQSRIKAGTVVVRFDD